MHEEHHREAHHSHLLKNEIAEVYINLIMRSFSLSLIGIFIPIYLIKLGFSINEAIIFIIIQQTVHSFFTPIGMLLAKKFGFKHIILYRMPLLITYLGAFYLITGRTHWIYLFAMIGGISESMYWSSLHSLFSKYSDKLHRGRQAGKITSLPQLAAVFGPSIGAIIAVTLGFKILFLTAIFLLLISVIPLFFTGDMKPHVTKLNFDLAIHKEKKMFMFFIAQGAMYIANAIIWPLFIFFTLNEITSVGFIMTVASIGTIMFTFYVGSATDRISRGTMIKIGGLLMAFTYFARIFIQAPSMLYTISFLAGLFIIMIDVPLLANFYDKSNKGNREEYIVMRQIGLGVGKFLMLIVAAYVLNKFLVSFSMAGITAIIVSLL